MLRALRRVVVRRSCGLPAREALEGGGVGHEPQAAESQEHAEVGREPRGHLQDGDHQDRRHAHEQHGQVAPRHRRVGRRLRRLRARDAQPPRLPRKAQQGDDADRERGEEQPRDRARHRDLLREPQHRRGHVPDGAPCAARVRGDDEEAADGMAQLPLPLPRHRVPEQLQADDRRREVVDHGAEEEAQDGEHGHQRLLPPPGQAEDASGDHGEAVEVVDGLHHAHRGQEEEDDCADVLQPVLELVLEPVVALLRLVRVVSHRQERPHRRRHDEHAGGLVQPQVVLQHYEHQTDGEQCGHQVGLEVVVVDEALWPATQGDQKDGKDEGHPADLQRAAADEGKPGPLRTSLGLPLEANDAIHVLDRVILLRRPPGLQVERGQRPAHVMLVLIHRNAVGAYCRQCHLPRLALWGHGASEGPTVGS
mmetsp:Transcript_93682/g.262069  ORF Transcript_93682/g.262069 Transcript_93682/m.262069 type:complete len:422 (+) Transcript_93682:721-1986(+)